MTDCVRWMMERKLERRMIEGTFSSNIYASEVGLTDWRRAFRLTAGFWQQQVLVSCDYNPHFDVPVVYILCQVISVQNFSLACTVEASQYAPWLGSVFHSFSSLCLAPGWLLLMVIPWVIWVSVQKCTISCPRPWPERQVYTIDRKHPKGNRGWRCRIRDWTAQYLSLLAIMDISITCRWFLTHLLVLR